MEVGSGAKRTTIGLLGDVLSQRFDWLSGAVRDRRWWMARPGNDP